MYLGLAIVKWIVTTHQALISINKGLSGRGSCFTVRFRQSKQLSA